MPAARTPPLPSEGFCRRAAVTATIIRRRLLYRVHRKEHAALFHGHTDANRFDAPDKDHGVCCLGLSLYAAFAETFLRRSGSSRHGWRTRWKPICDSDADYAIAAR